MQRRVLSSLVSIPLHIAVVTTGRLTLIFQLTLEFFTWFGSIVSNLRLCVWSSLICKLVRIFRCPCDYLRCICQNRDTTSHHSSTCMMKYISYLRLHISSSAPHRNTQALCDGGCWIWWTSRGSAALLFHWNDHSDIMSLTRMSVPSLQILWLYPHEYSFPMRTRAEWGDSGLIAFIFSLSRSDVRFLLTIKYHPFVSDTHLTPLLLLFSFYYQLFPGVSE